MKRTSWMPTGWVVFLYLVSLFVAAGCSPTGGPTTSDGDNTSDGDTTPVVIELADYTTAEAKLSPVGSGRIVGGHLLVDFQDSMSLAEIDAILAANNLQRVGHVSGTNVVTARSLDARDELEIQAAVASLAGVESVVLNHILEPDNAVGIISPVLDDRSGNPPFTLSDAELFANWPHYVMDTLPAHALADAVLGGAGLQDVVLAVVDVGGFQATTATTGRDSLDNSLLSNESGDSDLSTKVVSPTGIVVDQVAGTANIQVGTRDASFNGLIGTVGDSLHGLAVASAALASGEDLIGTGRHAKFRPVRISQLTEAGVCTNDRTITCNANIPCPEGMGSCDMDTATMDYLYAALTLLANDPATNQKVINLSIGIDIRNQTERDNVQAILSPVITRLVDGGRLVIASAGNESANTADRAFAVLGPTRDVSRSASGATALQKGLVIVGGTSLPNGNPADARNQITDPVLDFSGHAEQHDSDAATGDHLRISAPGNFVPVLKEDFTRRRAEGGTSFSAPYVAGLAAEMFAVDPSASNVEIIDIIERTADDLGTAGPDERFGFGRINCWKALLTLLNRKKPADNPDWLGIRFRFALEADETLQFSIDGAPVSNTGVRRVPDMAQVMDDNAREVPSADYLPAAVAAQFSMTTASLINNSQGVSLLKVTSGSGANVYEIPMRLSDLLSQRPVDSSLDDYVLTLDIHTRTAAVYGRVTAEGEPVDQATIRYLSIAGQESTTLSDANGYYTIYDAMPDTQFEITASQDDMIGNAQDITVPAFAAVRQDFVLSESEFPRTYVGTGTRKLFAEWDFLGGGSASNVQRLDVRIILQANGDVDATLTTPDGEVVVVPVIGGGTSTQILNNQTVETTCPDDATNNAGQTVDVVQFTFGQGYWHGKWIENGTYSMDYGTVYYDMTITGSFTEGTISGRGAWPNPEQYPRGAEMTNFICSHYLSTFYTRIEWDFSGDLVPDNDN